MKPYKRYRYENQSPLGLGLFLIVTKIILVNSLALLSSISYSSLFLLYKDELKSHSRKMSYQSRGSEEEGLSAWQPGMHCSNCRIPYPISNRLQLNRNVSCQESSDFNSRIIYLNIFQKTFTKSNTFSTLPYSQILTKGKQ